MSSYYLCPINWQQLNANGTPLSGGTVTTYQAGTSTPATTYTDNTGGTPQTNPITLNTRGLPPSPVWLLGGQSMKFVIKDSSGNLLQTFDGVTGVNDQTAIAASSGSGLVGWIAAGVGAVFRWLQDKVREVPATPQDYGAVADGAAVDVSAVKKAFAASKTVRFPPGTYNFGDIGGSGVLVDLTALGTGITMIFDAGAEMVCNTTDNTLTAFFLLESNSHFRVIGCPRFRDTGYTGASSPLRGAVGFLCTNYVGHSWGDINIDAIYGKNIVASFLCNGTVSATDRIRGIRIGHIFSDDCYYGFNAQNQGDGVYIGGITAYQNYRPYFVYGVTGHEVPLVFHRNPRTTTGSINISRSDGGLPTRGVSLYYVERENAVNTTTAHIDINHIGPSLGEISGIHVKYDIDDPVGSAPPVKFVTYTGSGGSETNAPLNNVVDDIHISGRYVGANGVVTCTAVYTSLGRLHWDGGTGSSFDSTIPAQFNLTEQHTYTPTWSCSSGAAPVLGNGTITGTYVLVDGICQATVELTIGSTSTPGGGVWQFSLPFASKYTTYDAARIFRSGVAFRSGEARVVGTTSQVTITLEGGTAEIQAGVPYVWAAGDIVGFTMRCPI